MLMIVALLIPCLIAGFRDYNIGTDVNVYIKPVIDAIRCNNENLAGLLYNELFVSETNGVFFTIVLYICSKFSNGVSIALFFIELLCLFPVYIVIRKQGFSSGLKALSLYCYYCFFYHLSLNIMKQFVAIAIMFWGFKYIKKGKYLKYVFLMVFTVLLVHKTAVLSLLNLLIYFLAVNGKELFVEEKLRFKVRIEKKSTRKSKMLFFTLILAAIIILLFNIKPILTFAALFKHSYVYQLSHMKNFEPKYSNIIIMTLILLPSVLFHHRSLINDYKYRFYTMMMISSLLLYQFVGVSPALYRISLYSMIFIVLVVPSYVKLFKNDGRVFFALYYFLVLTINFVFDVILNSYGGVYPYATVF